MVGDPVAGHGFILAAVPLLEGGMPSGIKGIDTGRESDDVKGRRQGRQR